jgi:hypothetical protein
MRLNTTVVLTFLLLIAMSGAGSASAWFGFKVGRDALKSVRQPEVNPTKKLVNTNPNVGKDGLEVLSEREILVRVYDYIHAQEQGESKPGNPPKTQSAQAPTSPSSESDTPEATDSETNPALENLPIQSQDQGVVIEITNVTQDNGSLLLDVNLQNQGTKAVRFLYSFLEVRDGQGRALSAITDGLPGELPATGKDYSGTIKIPMALLEEVEALSLTLTDYPDQKLQLNLTDIPVVQ